MSLKFESAQVGIICLKDGCQFCYSLHGKCLENKNRSKYAKKQQQKKRHGKYLQSVYSLGAFFLTLCGTSTNFPISKQVY